MIFSLKKRAALATSIVMLSGAELSFAATTYTWDGGVSGTGTDVNTAANWNPDGLPVFTVGNGDTVAFASTSPLPVGGVAQSGNFSTRFLNFGAGAGSYTWNIGANILGFGLATNTANRGAINNTSSNAQIFNVGVGGTLAALGNLNSTAGGGDIVVNGNLGVNVLWNVTANALQVQNSNSISGFTDLTGTGNFYFNVNSSIHPAGNDAAPGWAHGGGTTTVATNRGYLVVSTSGTAYLGNIGPDFRGTMHITSTTGGKLRLTHNNSLGASATGNGVEIEGGTTGNGTMELVGGITTGRDQLWLDGRSGAVANANHILNVSGNNTMTFNSWKTGISPMNARAGYASAGNWNIQSDSGLLTIGAGSGAITNETAAGVTNPGLITLNLKGAGNGQIDQQILKTGTNSSVNIAKSGAGTWTLTNANSFDNGTLHAYDGNVSITGGTLALSGAGSLANAASIEVKSGATFDFSAANGGVYTLNSANALVKGAGTIVGSLTAGFGNTIVPGDAGIGTLTVNGNLTLNGGSTLTYELTNNPSGSNDKIVTNGNLSIAGTTAVNVSGPIIAGNYALVDYSGSLSGFVPGSSFTVNGVSTFRQTFSVVNDVANTVLNLNVSGNAANLTWVGGVSSNTWDTVGVTNWSGAPDQQFFSNDNVTFGNTGSNSPSVNVAVTVAPGVVSLSNSTGHDYTFTGGDIIATTVNATGSGTNTFSNNNLTVSGAFTKSGSGNVVFSGSSVAFTGSVTIGGTGTVSVTSPGAFTTVSPIVLTTTGNGSLTINRPGDSTFGNSVSGTGTLRKDGTATTLIISGNNSGFSGTVLVAEGTVKTDPIVAGTLGTAGVTVLAGATFDTNGSNLNNTVVTIQGNGTGINGALTNALGGGTFGHLKGVKLAGDAKMAVPSASYLFIDGTDGNGTSASFEGQGNSVTFDIAAGAEIDLINVGNMNVNNVMVSSGVLYIGGNTSFGPTSGTMFLQEKGRLGIYGTGGELGARGSSGLLDKPITVDATTTGGGIEVYRGNNTLNSPITLNGNLQVDVLARDDGQWRQTLAGTLTGGGNLTVHGISSAVTRTGLVELTSSTNSYGTTTIGGGGSLFNTSSSHTNDSDRVILSIGNGGTTGKLGNGNVTLGNSGTLRFNRSNSHTVSNSVTGTGNVDQVGSGTTTLSGTSLTYSGNTTVSAGTLNITGSHTTGKNYNVASGANLVTNNVRVTTALTVNGTATINANGLAAGASKVETLTIGAGGKLNLKDNDLVVGTATDFNAVRTAIIAGKTNNAASGITSDITGFGISRGFGYAMGNDPKISSLLAGSLSGQTYDADSVLVKYTLLGDADLDGDTDLNDLGLWSNGYTGDLGVTTSPTTFWTGGDFDYDGDTDLNDLGLWSSTYTGDFNGGPGSLVVNAPNASPEAVAILNSMGITVVPEPSTFVLAGVGLAGLAIAARRRKK